MANKIAVIIPFYQEQPGILRRTIESVCAQSGVANVEVIVVDDGSPVPACEELRDLTIPDHLSLRVVEQHNAGPGAARNKGLDGVTDDTRYIAFLDSDDEWTTDHLCRALAALTRGYDFYFSNMFEIGQETSAFERNKRIDIRSHPRISGLDDIHEYCGDLFSQQIMHPVIDTPTVVYRYANFRRIRFSERLLNACEDHLCWLEFAAKKPRIAFSSRPGCRAGRGVNVFFGIKWGTEESLRSHYYSFMYKREVDKKYNLSDELRSFNNCSLREIRNNFAYDLLHIIRVRGKLDLNIVFHYYLEDPKSIFRLFFVASRIIAKKIRSHSTQL